MDTESVFDLDTNVINLKEADKSVRDTISALSGAIKKGVGDANKGAQRVRKGVSDKATYFFGRNVQSDKALVSHFPNILPLHLITNFSFSPIG